jgi:electron transport complex protein RnfD
MNKLIVSPSPHVHGGDSVKKNMCGVILALAPALLVSLYFFGLGALIVTLVSIASCVLFEAIIQKYLLKTEISIKDGSAFLTGLLLAFNLPSNLPVWMVIVGAAVAIGIGKMTFGGLGNNLFNPALVGRVFLLISFPVQMTSWALPAKLPMTYTDAVTGATPLGIMKEGLMKGETVSTIMSKLPSLQDMMLGNIGGSMGEISAIALILGGIFLLWRKIITWHIPVSMIAAIAIFAGILHTVNPEHYAGPVFHILTGGVLLGAIFMATDYVTSPMSKKGMLIYGTLIGVLTVLIRVFGSYPEGVSFAILIMNAFTPLINKYVKPKRYGEVIKK